MIQAYIDESGNMGRGGKYFVLAAVVFDTEKGKSRAKRIIRKEQQLIAKADIDIFYLVIDKARVTLLQQSKPKNLVYNYFAKLLTDEIFKKYNGDFRIVFDQRATAVKSMNSLTDYITINAYTSFNLVKNQVEVLQRDSKTENNLQTADLIAGTIYQAYNRHQPHFLELIQTRIVGASEFPAARFRGALFRGGN